MNGKYKTPDGKEVMVLEFDEPNKLVFAKFSNGDKKWVGRQEYSEWMKEGEDIIYTGSEEIADVTEDKVVHNFVPESYEPAIEETSEIKPIPKSHKPKREKETAKISEKKQVKKSVKRTNKK